VQELKSGGVASILHQDAGCLGDLTNAIFLDPWRAAVQIAGSLCVLAWVDWRMLLGTMVLLPGVYIMHRTWANRIRPQYREIHAQRQSINAHVVEAFGGMRVVRAFGRERSETARYMYSNDLMARQQVRVWWWSTFIQIVWGSLIPLGIAGLLLIGGWQVIHARLSTGSLMMFMAFIVMLFEPISALAQSATQLQTSFSSLDRVLDLLDAPREVLHTPHAITVRKGHVRGRITLENVTFCYPGQTRSAVKEIQLDVLPGQTIALVGRSGSGKTTLCNLVARFYDPTQGKVLLDGQDLRNIDVESYRNLLGVVEQEVFLFDGTVADNISYAKRNSPDEEIRAAATIAHADEFIRELPEGYETIIGERGVKLSGGQRQRLAIARAVLADPRILILDEATSNLDTMSERYIQESLRELMRNRTCFVIAHRLSTIAHADQVVVLDGGRIVEKGTQEELLEADSKYREMVYAQVGQVSPLFGPR
jgi:ATP-binding cassette subfamily B protein/subfamily B ATP-binding cassette protein MsbA